MKTILIAVLAVLCVALAGVLGYQKLTQPETTPVVVNQPNDQSAIVPANCLKAGETGSYGQFDDGKTDKECCDELSKVFYRYTQDDGSCAPASGTNFVCVACGNGACTKGENKCNCPQDCK